MKSSIVALLALVQVAGQPQGCQEEDREVVTTPINDPGTPTPEVYVDRVSVSNVESVSSLDLKKPELMSSVDRDSYISSAFDRSQQGKAITIPNGQTRVLSPGTYQWDPASVGSLSYTSPGSAQVWNLFGGATFTLSTPQIIAATVVGGTVDYVKLYYFPYYPKPGTGLTIQFDTSVPVTTIVIPHDGPWVLVHTTAAAVFVRSFSGSGPIVFNYAVGVGDVVIVSQTAHL